METAPKKSKQILLIDVREKEEFMTYSIAGSISIPINNLKEKNTLNVNVKLNRRSETRLGNNFKVSLDLITGLLIFIFRKNK